MWVIAHNEKNFAMFGIAHWRGILVVEWFHNAFFPDPEIEEAARVDEPH